MNRIISAFAILSGFVGALISAHAAVVPDVVYNYQEGGNWVWQGKDPQQGCDIYWANTAVDKTKYSSIFALATSYGYGCAVNVKATGARVIMLALGRVSCSTTKPFYNYSTHVCQADVFSPPDPVEPPPDCTAGSRTTVTYKVSYSGDSIRTGAPVDGSTDGQCALKLVDVQKCYKGSDGFEYCQYVGERTGQPLKPADASSSAPVVDVPSEVERTDVPPFTGKPGSGCPKGTVQGGVGADGIPHCIGTGSAPKNPAPAPKTSTTSATTTNDDGSTTTTTTTTQTNADGSTTTTVDKVTTAPSGTVTKEQSKNTSNTPSGAPGKETSPQEQQSFCKQNPTLAVCRDSSVSGSCEQTACTGDAIQCATLQAARAMECKARKDDEDLKASALHQLGKDAASGNDPNTGLPVPGKGEVVQVSALKAEGWLGGGSPLRDTTFIVQGKSITIPFSKASEYLLALRYALMVVASLISFRMLSGVILRD